VSALQCPTRLLVARHGEAEYESTTVTDDGGSLTARGRAQARALAEELRGERIARIWCSPLSRAVQTAEIVAAALSTDGSRVDVVVREGLREYGVGSLAGTPADEREELGPVFAAWAGGDDEAAIPGGERLGDIVARMGAVLEEIADQHRGEAVLVVGHGGSILTALPELVGRPRASACDLTLPHAGHVELEVDADGWRLVRFDEALA
jgi:2,3-bisphosphoglycerate-dependent phosphoglycerate mutase